MSNIMFSIIVPIYRVEAYLRQCIESLIKQTYINFEIILVDDGSPDNCPDICDEYADLDKRIKVVHKPNGGIVSARQAGVDEAAGEYIACVDGDDWISKDYLAKFAEIIENHNPDVVCCGAVWVYENKEEKKPLDMQPGIYTRADIENKIFPILIESEKGIYFSPTLWAKTIRRTMYFQHQLKNTKVNIGEDNACVKPCIYFSQSLIIIPECLYYYRQNPTSITKKRKAFDWNAPRIIGQHFEKNIDMSQYDFQEQVYRNVVHNLFNVAVSQFSINEPKSKIINEIKVHIEESYYRKAIEKCCYKGNIKGLLARFSLYHKIYWLMYMYYILEKRAK